MSYRRGCGRKEILVSKSPRDLRGNNSKTALGGRKEKPMYRLKTHHVIMFSFLVTIALAIAACTTATPTPVTPSKSVVEVTREVTRQVEVTRVVVATAIPNSTPTTLVDAPSAPVIEVHIFCQNAPPTVKVLVRKNGILITRGDGGSFWKQIYAADEKNPQVLSSEFPYQRASWKLELWKAKYGPQLNGDKTFWPDNAEEAMVDLAKFELSCEKGAEGVTRIP